MTSVQELLSAYIAEHRREGHADPTPYLDKVRGCDQAELAALIDHFLVTTERRPFDASAFERFRSRPDVVQMSRRILDDASETLLELRRRAGVSKQDLGKQLARDLGVEGDAGEVKARYHDLETGNVDPARVRTGVWESLAAAFGVTVASVRAAAGTVVAQRHEGAFARTDPTASPTAPPVTQAQPTAAERRIDEIFFARDDD